MRHFRVYRRSIKFRRLSFLSWAICLGVFFLLTPPALPQSLAVVQILKIQGTISPITADRLSRAIEVAVKKKAQCLIIELDTPGGLDQSMRQMVKDILSSPLPIIVYVYPRGGRSASAGVFITLAAHIAAMAPGTNIGAAHPVSLGGGLSGAMEEKVINDAAAYIKSIAQRRARNEEWAEKAVRESVSITAREAQEIGVVDLVAEDISDLLSQLEGGEVKISGKSFILHTRGAPQEYMGISFKQKFLQKLADPNLAYILLMVGIWGIILEFFHPGVFLPGIAGSISLILSFFALQILPFNLVGLLLIILAVILFVLEIKVLSYGALTIGGIISLTLGSFMLIEPSAIYITISWEYIIAVVIVTTLIFVFIVGYAIRAQFKKPVTGEEGMVGSVGIARGDLDPQGKIQIHGEIWNAVNQFPEHPIEKGEEVEVIRVEGMKLMVKKKEV